MERKFYEFCQNNSGGNFHVDDKICHRLFIEAKNSFEANAIAEDLGIYFDGVENDIDCSCCGDRWNESWNHINIEKWKEEGYDVSIYSHYENSEQLWYDKYGKYIIIKKPEWINKDKSYTSFNGKIAFRDIEEYAQYVSNDFGWTSPDTRIFYKDGTVKEIFKNKY